MAALTDEQRADFHRDGYLRYGAVIDAATVERLREELDRVIAEELALTPQPPLPRTGEGEQGSYPSPVLGGGARGGRPRPPEFAFGHDRGGERRERAIHQFVNMWKVSPVYEEVIHHPVITAAVRELMGVQRIRLWHDQVISKPPGENKHFACHHDFYFWPLDRPRMVTCWLALDDATPENGCMHVVPGSHRDPRYQPPDCELTDETGLVPAPMGPGAPGSLYEEIRTWMPDRAVPVPLPAGGCMFHHCLNYHMTPQNVTDRQRRAFVMIYMPDGTRYNHGQSPNHPCTSYLGLNDGQLLDGDEFPVCG